MVECSVRPLRFIAVEEADNDEPEYGRGRYTEMGDVVLEPLATNDSHESHSLQPNGDFVFIVDEILGEISYEECVPSFLTAPCSQRNSFDDKQTIWSCRNTAVRNTFSPRNTFDESQQENIRSTVRRSTRCMTGRSLPPESNDMDERTSTNSRGSMRHDGRVVAGAASILRNIDPHGRCSNRSGDRSGSRCDMELFDEATLTEFVPYEQTWGNPSDIVALHHGLDDASIEGRSTRVGTEELAIDNISVWSCNATLENFPVSVEATPSSSIGIKDFSNANVDAEEELSLGVQIVADTSENIDFMIQGHSGLASCETVQSSVQTSLVLKAPAGPASRRPGGRFASKSSSES
mmetsp:Transcript_101976/g.161172  ORF Transcript_101976/g.161172 Transcript_101976/m.161172 type:complete len:349 (+) Transcript_101976:76-1122(+)